MAVQFTVVRPYIDCQIVALFCLMHLGVTCAGSIPRRARCFNHRGIHSRPLDSRSFFLKRYWLIKPKIFSIILCASNGCESFGTIVSSRIEPLPKRKTCKSTHGLNSIACLFHRQVAQSLLLLHAGNSNHRRKRIRKSAHSKFGINRVNKLEH